MIFRVAIASVVLGTLSFGLEIPSFGLGTSQVGVWEGEGLAQYALSIGVRQFHASPTYGNQVSVGNGLCTSGYDREDYWVTSKLTADVQGRVPILMTVENTLGELLSLYLDLYLLTWPLTPGSAGDSVRLVETWRTMEDLVRWDRTRHIGVSNFSPADLETILSICQICPYAHEFELHPYLQQQEFVDWHLERGIRPIAALPLGDVDSLYGSGSPSLLEDPFWVDLAQAKNSTVAQAALAWGIQRGTVVVPTSTEGEGLLENVGALDIVFTEEEMEEIAQQDRNIRFSSSPGPA